MSIAISIITLLCWCAYALMEGNREAFIFHSINVDKHSGRKLHILWTIQRALVITLVALLCWRVAIACALVFPFLHDGSYYSSRNDFDKSVYPHRWFAQSTTSTALTTKLFTPIVRIILALAGVGFFVYQFFA